jgi:cysteine desulfurase
VIYLDYNATTPCDPDISNIIHETACRIFGNPASIHRFGQQANQIIETCKHELAEILDTQPDELFFTSGGTESDNMAIIGIANAYARKGRHIITSACEHKAVYESCKYLSKNGYTITYVEPDNTGLITVNEIQKHITDDTILISIIHTNNETGVTQPISDIAYIAKENNIPFHTDTVQALGKMDISLQNISAASFSAHKIYGPKGIGLLYLKQGTRFNKILHGGEQQQNTRPGTLNTPSIAGFTEAVKKIVSSMQNKEIHFKELHAYFLKLLQQNKIQYHLNGSPTNKAFNTINISFPGVYSETLVIGLDMEQIAVSAGSACESGSSRGSRTLAAMKLASDIQDSAIRISMGKDTTKEELKKLSEALHRILKRSTE